MLWKSAAAEYTKRMKGPLISVVIPVYNEEKRIVRAINSMREQTYDNLEIIIVDDGSTDGTKAAVEVIAQIDPRVQYHYHHNPNERRTNWRGYDINAGYGARAYGFSIARGEWLTTQDADDASLLNRIEVQHDLAMKYGATLVTVLWMPVTEYALGKKLDVDRIVREKGEHAIVIRPETLNTIVAESTGVFMRLPFHRLIPFPFKWFPYTRRLFYGKMHQYPGADNSMLFRREVIQSGINLRHRNARTWGVPAGRGSGRDFVFHTAHVFRNNWSFRLPLYLWDVKQPNAEFVGYEKYLI